MRHILILLILLLQIGNSAEVRPVFNPIKTIDWYFFGDNFNYTIKLCSCQIGDTGLRKSGFEASFYEPIGLIDVAATPWDFPSIGLQLDKSMGRKQGVARDDEDHGSAFKYTHFIIYPIFAVLNFVTDYVCFERLSVLSFGFMSEVNPAWNNDSIASFLSPEKILFALASPMCILDCAASSVDKPINSLYFCAGCWAPLGTNTGWTPGSQPVTEAGTLAVRLLDNMHKTYALTKTSNAGFSNSATNTVLKSSMCQESYFPLILKSQYKLQLAYPVTWDAITIGKIRVPWADNKLGKDRLEDIAFWVWRKRDMCSGAYKCESTFAGTKQ